MTALILVCHPDSAGLSHAAAERVVNGLDRAGHGAHCHDLYAEHFEPVLENEDLRRRFSFDDGFARYGRELRLAAGLVLVYPDWWGMPPAMLKGWIDRILRPELAYRFSGAEFGPSTVEPLLVDKRAWVITTTNETNPLSQVPMQSIWRERVFGYVGIEAVMFHTLYNVRNTTLRERRTWLRELDEVAERWLR